MPRKSSAKIISTTPNSRLSAGDLEIVQNEDLKRLEKGLLTDNAESMEQAGSRAEIVKIADGTLEKLAKLYGRSVNDLGEEMIREVYKPAFIVARKFGSANSTKDEPLDSDQEIDDDGFYFELVGNEIESLEDSTRKEQAKKIFFAALDKIRIGKELKDNYDIAVLTAKKLAALYSDSDSYEHDFPRLEGQLYTAARQRNQFLKKIGKWQQNQSSGM